MLIVKPVFLPNSLQVVQLPTPGAFAKHNQGAPETSAREAPRPGHSKGGKKKTHRPSTIHGAIHHPHYPILTIHPLTAVQGTSQRGHQPATKGQRRRALINLRRLKYNPSSSRNRQLFTGIAVGATRVCNSGIRFGVQLAVFLSAFFFARQTIPLAPFYRRCRFRIKTLSAPVGPCCPRQLPPTLVAF